MSLIGFSTGALARGDFRKALSMLADFKTGAIELSALRDVELGPLMDALPQLDLEEYSYISVHVPSAFTSLTEREVAERLHPCLDRNIAIVVHPDTIEDPACWDGFGHLFCIENMDKRKRTGRTVDEMEEFFTRFPEATFCLDIAHARQIDSSMAEAHIMLRQFATRLRQIHISELDSQCRHHRLSVATISAARGIASLIDNDVPAIIEARIDNEVDMASEIDAVRAALYMSQTETEHESVDWGAMA